MGGVVITPDAKGKGHNIIVPIVKEAPTLQPTEVRTIITDAGTWTIRLTPVMAYDSYGNKEARVNITAMFLPTGARRASLVVKKEKLLPSIADQFDPRRDFKAALQADHRHARAIREALSDE